jgi:hypothetical protein
MPFCVSCGKELPASVAFCPNCGASVTQKVTPSPAPSSVVAPSVPVATESVVYSIDVEEPRVQGTKYLLVFTDRRIVAAFESGGLTRLATAGVGRMAYDDAKMQQMKGKTIDELLSDNRSFFIPYNEIRVIEFEAVVKKVLLSTINYILLKVNRTAGSQQELMIPRTKPEKLDEIERYLRPVFREKLKVRTA